MAAAVAPPTRVSPMRRACHSRVTKCPSGHELTLWTARAGRCDSCHRMVAHGEQVMDCRACNWYLCEECRPCTFEQAESLWGAISNLLFGDVCRAPPDFREGQANEVVIASVHGLVPEDEVVEDPRMFRPKAVHVEFVESQVAANAKRSESKDPHPTVAAAHELSDLLDFMAEPLTSSSIDPVANLDFGGIAGDELPAAGAEAFEKVAEAALPPQRGAPFAALGGA